MKPSCPFLLSISVSHIDILSGDQTLAWHVIEVWESKKRQRIYIKGKELFQTISKLYLLMNAKSDYKANRVHKLIVPLCNWHLKQLITQDKTVTESIAQSVYG